MMYSCAQTCKVVAVVFKQNYILVETAVYLLK